MDTKLLLNEVNYKAIRSSGSGGQNVNKVATKVQLSWDLDATLCFDDTTKEKLKINLSNRLTKAHILILSCDESRSQLKNKSTVTNRFIQLLKDNLKEDKKRIITKIPKAIKKKRLDNKRKNAEKKANRKPPKI